MLEIPLMILYFLAPILIPIAIVVYVLRRRTKKHLLENRQKLSALRDEVRELGKELVTLRAQVGWLTGKLGEGVEAPEKPEFTAPEPSKWAAKPVAVPTEEISEPPPEAKKATPGPEYDFGGPSVEAPRQKIEAELPKEALPPITPRKPAIWEQLANRFLENWTGVLGTIVLVAGIGFVGTYAALRLSPFFRFLLVLAASGALYAGFKSLQGRENWEAMSLWLRSAAAAVFLFACAAAGGLPNAGLMWIDSAGPALAVLFVGIALNLALSWSVAYQGFASLHVALSLIPIAILPQNPLALGIATVVAAFGVFLTYRRYWPIHLAVTLLVYLAYHVFWLVAQPALPPLPGDLAALATGSAALVFLGGALAHHSQAFRRERLDMESVLTHLLSWGLLVTFLFVHLGQMVAYRGALLSAALMSNALIAWGMSASARKDNVDWLRTADVLIAQGLVLASLFAWRTHLGEPIMFYGLVFVETLLFLRLVVSDRAGTSAVIGAYAAAVAAIIFIIAGAWTIGDISTPVGTWQLAAAMVAGLVVTIAAGAYFDRYYRERLDTLIGPGALRVIGALAGLMTIVALMALKNELLLGLIALAIGAALILVANRLRPLGLIWGAWIILIAVNLVAWVLCFAEYAGDAREQVFQLAPSAALAFLAIWKTPEHRASGDFRRAAIYLLGINLGLSAYLLMSPPSALLPTVAWLVMSLVALEIAGRIRNVSAALATLHIGLLYIAAAAVGYVTVVLPTYSYIGNFNVRLAIEIFGMATLIYWWIVQPREPLAGLAQWRQTQPYFLELTLVLVTTTVFVEVPLIWRAVAWMALALLFLVPRIARLANRFAFYSLAAFVTSVLALTINVSTVSVPSPNWFDQPWNAGLIAVVIQVFYLFQAYQRLELNKVTFPAALSQLARLSRFFGRDLAATICYPFFAGLALFLAWRFEQALLTFLWAFEVFVIFVLSIVFRENHFRLVALAGMAACLIRLVTYDMREADLFVRGLVFIGVGLLMLAMNAVYNKYGSRVRAQ